MGYKAFKTIDQYEAKLAVEAVELVYNGLHTDDDAYTLTDLKSYEGVQGINIEAPGRTGQVNAGNKTTITVSRGPNQATGTETVTKVLDQRKLDTLGYETVGETGVIAVGSDSSAPYYSKTWVNVLSNGKRELMGARRVKDSQPTYNSRGDNGGEITFESYDIPFTVEVDDRGYVLYTQEDVDSIDDVIAFMKLVHGSNVEEFTETPVETEP